MVKCFCRYLDEDECQKDSAICQNGLCVNEIGGYRCECAAGYVATSDRKRCQGKFCSELT